MAGQCQRQVVRGDATPVVAHPQQLDAALLHFDVDAPGAGVQAVFQEFLDDRGGALDHFAGGDLVRQPRAQQLDARQFAHGWAARVAAGIFRVWPTFMLSLFSELALRRAAMLTS
ncbi:hypothetical protein D9M70_607990 [compost metagenome]